MKRSLSDNLVRSVAVVLFAGCSQHIYKTDIKQSIMNTLSLDTAYIKDKFDVKDFEKKNGDVRNTLVYIDPNGYEIRITKSFTHRNGTYDVVVYPPGKYYFIYQHYDAGGNIKQRGKQYFGWINIGEWEYYDSDGNKKVKKHEFPPNKFTLDDVYAFMEKKGWVDANAKNRRFLKVILSSDTGNWLIEINDMEKYYRIDYELHRNTGRVIKKSEGYYMPVL